MKRILDKLTPGLILQWEKHMLLNSPLAWQFQLPRILWFWVCITTAGLIIPFAMEIDISRSSDDVETIALFTIVLGILQFFLYGYILIQFNSTKNFISRRWWHGMVEQLAYILIMMLCVSQFMVYCTITNLRKASYISEEEINSEILTYNKAVHYFMANSEQYRYFPDEKSFLVYMSKIKDSDEDAENYYYNYVTPELKPYFTRDPLEMKSIDGKHTRHKKAPRLYYIGQGYMKNKFEVYSDNIFSSSGYYVFGSNYTPHTFQLHSKTKEERLKDIRAFIKLIKKYDGVSYSNNDGLVFDDSETILNKYFDNQFSVTHRKKYPDEYADVITTYQIESIYENVMRSKIGHWKFLYEMGMVLFFISFPVGVLFFIFKNGTLRPMIVSILTVIIIGIVSVIIAILTRSKEDFIVHIPILVFIYSLVMFFSPYSHYSQFRMVFIIIANCCLAAVPIYLFFYFTEYLDLFRMSYEDCNSLPDLCAQNREVIRIMGWVSFWGGIAFYLLIGTFLFKRKYETIWAQPMNR
jgi:hypothetical protein